jgi:hypothetical protein
MIRPKMGKPRIRGIEPKVALPGGLVRIAVEGIDASGGDVAVSFDSRRAALLGVSSKSMLARVPAVAGKCSVTAEQRGASSSSITVYIGSQIAAELNPVANPATDKAGNIYVTFSGPRGASVPFSVYRISAQSDAKEPFLADILNATGIVVGPDDTIYISSRHTGTVYKSDMSRKIEKFAENLGIATGVALDAAGNLYVGDRGGPIHKLDPTGRDEVLCEIEPSVSAFHLAMRQDGVLFVTGPTLATQDGIYEIGKDRKPKVFFRGIGRPQGIAFDSSGRLLVAGSYKGERGIFAIGPERKVEKILSSTMLVGLAITPGNDLILADSNSLYRIPAGYW